MARRENPYYNLIGRRFGRLVVVAEVARRVWKCKCDCGNEKTVKSLNLLAAYRKSCGCLRREPKNLKHGMKGTPEYQAWIGMHARCSNKNDKKNYKNYMARGITVCQRWNNFEAFYFDMGKRPSAQHSLDRINNDGNYEPSNCRWADRKTQVRNSRLFIKDEFSHLHDLGYPYYKIHRLRRKKGGIKNGKV